MIRIEEQEKKKKFERFFASTYPKVKMFAWKILKSEDDAEDIAQDVFVKLWLIPDIWDTQETKDSYIFTVVRNQIYNFLKHKSVEYAYQEKFLNENPFISEIDGYDKIYAHEIELLLKLTIDKMSEQRKKVFLMSRQKEMSNQEIADNLGISIRTVERHIYLALLELKKKLLFLILIYTLIE